MESTAYNLNFNADSELPRMALTFLDPEYFAGNTTSSGGGTSLGIELETEYICVVCCGVVLNPLECK